MKEYQEKGTPEEEKRKERDIWGEGKSSGEEGKQLKE